MRLDQLTLDQLTLDQITLEQKRFQLLLGLRVVKVLS